MVINGTDKTPIIMKVGTKLRHTEKYVYLGSPVSESAETNIKQ